MDDVTQLYIAYGVAILTLIIVGVAMWKSGKDGDL